MDPLIKFSIPLHGIGDGIHQFEYQIGASFFKQFEQSPIQHASVELDLELERKPGLIILNFDFSGTVQTNCDRCLAEIQLPISGSERILVKTSYETESNDPEIVYLSPDAEQLKIGGLVYEFIVLAVPMIKVFDCEEQDPLPCNEKMLDHLDDSEEDLDPGDNPVWEALKKFNPNK